MPIPLFKRKSQKGLQEEEDLQHTEDEPAVVAVTPKPTADRPDDTWTSDSQIRLMVAGGDDLMVTDSAVVGAKLSLSAWKRGVGRLCTQHVREASKPSAKCSALIVWYQTAYVGCYDGGIFRCNVTEAPATELVAPHEGDRLIETMCACGTADTPEPELIAAGTSKGTVYLYNATGGEQVAELKGHKSSVRSLCWAAAFRTVLSIADEDNRIVCWRQGESGWAAAREITGFLRFGVKVSRMAWDADAQSLAVGDSVGNLYLWHSCESFSADADLPTPKILEAEVTAVTHLHSHCGDFVCGDNKKMRVFDATSGSLLRSFIRPEKETITAVSVSPTAVYSLEPGEFPKCFIHSFCLPQRRVTRSASSTSSPVNTSFGPGGAGSPVAGPMHVKSVVPPRSRTSGGSSGGKQSPYRGVSPQQQSFLPAPIAPGVPAPVTRQSIPAAVPAATAADPQKTHKTQGSLDFDNFASNRSMGGPPSGTVMAFPFSQGSFDAPVVAGAEDLFSAAPAKSFKTEKDSNRASSPAPASNSGIERVDSTAFSAEVTRVSHPTRAAPRPGGSNVASPRSPALPDRHSSLERAFQLLGGTAQLEKLKLSAAQSEDFSKAREIKEVIDALTATTPAAAVPVPQSVIPSYSFGAGPSASGGGKAPPAGAAPQFTPVVPVPSKAGDPLAGFF
eukprot:Hpha_TRINITY_DN20483_c0_g1::TRINITY_DN20483_c0_g1_i1::g.64153::m.64153